MVVTRSQAKLNQGNQTEEKISAQNKMVQKRIVIDSETSYTSLKEIGRDIRGILDQKENRKEYIISLFKKLLYKSFHLDTMHSIMLLKVLVDKIVTFSGEDYSSFSEFLLPMYIHVHDVCRSVRNKDVRMDDDQKVVVFDDTVSMDRMFSQKEGCSHGAKDVLFNLLCISTHTDPIYKNMLSSIYTNDEINLSKYRYVVQGMLDVTAKYML